MYSGEDFSHKSDKNGEKQRASWVLEARAWAGSVLSAGFEVQQEARETRQVMHSLR